jgi:hypothetical protein
MTMIVLAVLGVGCARLLCNRIQVEQGFDDGAFGHLVDFADVIAILLAPHGELVEVERGAIDDRPRLASGFHRRIEHGMHDVWQ